MDVGPTIFRPLPTNFFSRTCRQVTPRPPIHTAPHRTAPHRTAPHRTAPHRTAPHRTTPHTAAVFISLPFSTPSPSRPLPPHLQLTESKAFAVVETMVVVLNIGSLLLTHYNQPDAFTYTQEWIGAGCGIGEYDPASRFVVANLSALFPPTSPHPNPTPSVRGGVRADGVRQWLLLLLR